MTDFEEFEHELKIRGVYGWFDAYVERGWWPLVFELIENLMEMGWDGELHQIKEKFGTLRFYIGNGTADMFNLIHKYEDKTRSICEYCGKHGSKSNLTGWIKTLCAEHRNEGISV